MESANNRQTPDVADESTVTSIIERARRGDKTVVSELRSLLDASPTLWHAIGDLSRHNFSAWVELLSGGDLLVAESIRRSLGAMQEGLLGPNPTQLEVLLTERVASCYAQLQFAESTIANKVGANLPLSYYLLKRADSSNRRLTSAIKLLITVQHLMRSAKLAGVTQRTGAPATDGENSGSDDQIGVTKRGKKRKPARAKPRKSTRLKTQHASAGVPLVSERKAIEKHLVPVCMSRGNGSGFPVNRLLGHLPIGDDCTVNGEQY